MSNGYSIDDLETFVTPSLKEDLPDIHLPGDTKFSSYKNTFQEYCQKKHLTNPSYKIKSESDGFVGSVSFSLNHVRSTTVCSNIKEAEQKTAFDALREIGYLKDTVFEMDTNAPKRKIVDGDSETLVSVKQVKLGNVVVDANSSAKSKLNEIAQKKKLPMPIYKCIPVEGGFSCTVRFNGNVFKSSENCIKRKVAEQNAAESCLRTLTLLSDK